MWSWEMKYERQNDVRLERHDFNDCASNGWHGFCHCDKLRVWGYSDLEDMDVLDSDILWNLFDGFRDSLLAVEEAVDFRICVRVKQYGNGRGKMNIRELKEKLQGVYDFSNAVDCQAVISMLLKDLTLESKRADLLSGELKVLAKLVSDGKPEGKVRADNIINGIKQKVDVMGFLGRMSDNMTKAEQMTDTQLHDEVMQMWGEYDMASKESGALGELLKRFKEGNHVGNQVSEVRQEPDELHK